MILNYLKTAWRNIIRQRTTSLINITGLSIGMTVAILIFIWVQNELSFDSYHADAKNIYRITNYIGGKEKGGVESSPYPMGVEAKTKVPGVIEVTRMRPYGIEPAYFNIKGEFFREDHALYVDDEWFNVFHYDFIYGNATAFNSTPYSVVLTASKAKKYFGNGNPVGRSVRIDTMDYTVQAVIKDNPANSSFQYDVLIPYAARALNARNRDNDAQWGNYGYLTFVKLLPAADPVKVAEALKNIINTARETTNAEVGLLPLPAIHFENGLSYSRLQHGNMRMVYIFAVLGILVLAIACINYMNLATARASVRMKEVSVKKIMGAGRKHLFLQFVLESALVSLIALAVAALLLKLGLPWFNNFTEKQFVLTDSLQAVAAIFTGTFLLSVLLTSIYPALLLSSFNPLAVFRGRSIFKMKDVVLRKSLVVVQFTVSIVLIVGTICIYRQMEFIQEQNDSYDKSQLFTFSIPFKRIRDLDDKGRETLTSSIKQSLLSQSSVENASLMGQESVVNMLNQSSGSNDWIGRPKDFRPFIAFFDVDTSFNTMLNLQIKEGRWFLPNNQADKHNVILNETAVAEFGLKEPVAGQYFVNQSDTGVIAGVVKDFYYRSMHEKIGPIVLRHNQAYSSSFLVKTVPGKITEAKNAAEKVWKQFLPADPFSFTFVDEEFENIYRADHKASALILLFSLLTILISCLGLYGLATFTAEHRRKEIGIRKVLGASIAGIIGLLSKDFLKLVCIAILIASPIAWWAMNKWLEDFAYRIHISWWMFAAAGALALLIAFFSIGFRSASAASSNPVKALRTE